MTRRMSAIVVGLLLAASPLGAAATSTDSLFGINMSKSGESLSVPMQIVILLTLLTLLPAVVMSITPFLRIAIVLHFLRQALGTQTTPSNQVLLGISLFLVRVAGRTMLIAASPGGCSMLEGVAESGDERTTLR